MSARDVVTAIDLSHRDAGHARGPSRIIAGTQIGHVVLWHSPNDCNTLRHCSQPRLRACTHNIVLRSSPMRPELSNNAPVPMAVLGERFPCVVSDGEAGRCRFARVSPASFSLGRYVYRSTHTHTHTRAHRCQSRKRYQISIRNSPFQQWLRLPNV